MAIVFIVAIVAYSIYSCYSIYSICGVLFGNGVAFSDMRVGGCGRGECGRDIVTARTTVRGCHIVCALWLAGAATLPDDMDAPTNFQLSRLIRRERDGGGWLSELSD